MPPVPRILEKIVARKREEVAELARRGIHGPREQVPLRRHFRQALLASPEVAIIAEVKKASPSKGLIAPDFDPEAIARDYAEGGAACISVLTDQDFFQGSLDYLTAVRECVDLPVLRKDFIIDPLQVKEAALFGADCILLIAAILETGRMRDLRQLAEALDMDVLVEVHDEDELERALESGADLIGVNNRNLRDFTVDTDTTLRLRRLVPPEIPVVAESGLRTREDIVRLGEAGVSAALIGESLMRAPNRWMALRSLLGKEG